VSEGAAVGLIVAGIFFAVVILPLLWYVLVWRRPQSPQGQHYAIPAPIIDQLTKRIADLEEQVMTANRAAQKERDLCEQRMSSLMREIGRLTLKLSELEVHSDFSGHSGSRIYTKMIDSMGETDIRALAFGMDIDYDSLDGDNAHARALDLVVRCKRMSRMEELTYRLRQARPEIDWPEPS
jgi:hypothetical protein